MATMKCDVCNEPDQEVGKLCSFCEEMVGGNEIVGDEDLTDAELGYLDFEDDEIDEDGEPVISDVPFSEMVPTD